MILLPAILLAISSAAEVPVSMFPSDAIERNNNYRDWYGPELERLGEIPLWVDSRVAPGKQTIRFTFIPGATRIVGRNATVIRIEIEEGKGRLIARTEIYDHRKHSIREVAGKSLFPTEIIKLQDLVGKADPWKFPIGTWDEPDQLSIHCTELLMERRQHSGYAVSHILISCNQPNRLMPLVDYITELAGQKRKDLRY
tara:strand:+ start:415 stop:1008 length:594 start_codon:yes stop_codon:yes gene_type:complete